MKMIPLMYRGRASAISNISWSLPMEIGCGLDGYLLDINLELPLKLTVLLYFSSNDSTNVFQRILIKGELGKDYNA